MVKANFQNLFTSDRVAKSLAGQVPAQAPAQAPSRAGQGLSAPLPFGRPAGYKNTATSRFTATRPHSATPRANARTTKMAPVQSAVSLRAALEAEQGTLTRVNTEQDPD